MCNPIFKMLKMKQKQLFTGDCSAPLIPMQTLALETKFG